MRRSLEFDELLLLEFDELLSLEFDELLLFEFDELLSLEFEELLLLEFDELLSLEFDELLSLEFDELLLLEFDDWSLIDTSAADDAVAATGNAIAVAAIAPAVTKLRLYFISYSFLGYPRKEHISPLFLQRTERVCKLA